MTQLAREDLMSLEEYAQRRDEMRKQVMEEKKARRILVGPHVMLHFENRLIMHYQIQEMLRAEKIFEADGIQEELDAYNPLIPDGSNWKATMMIEFPDPEIRAVELTKLIGIEEKTWVQVDGFEKVYAICNEDLIERTTEEKTSSVHFMRFELTDEMVSAAKSGAAIRVGIDHENYQHQVEINGASRESLLADLAA
ncbi:MAG TPA: DUF3501 family protein [Chromatiales bacterium]|nr:DUF3501 family protein [Thiotrichales bacterium]HIP68431.1 DUF3501 family protein [Chromatiales bacterium]